MGLMRVFFWCLMGIKLLVSSFPVQRGVRFLLYWCTYGMKNSCLMFALLSVMHVCSGLFGQGRQGRCRITVGRELWRSPHSRTHLDQVASLVLSRFFFTPPLRTLFFITFAQDFPHPISDDIEDLELAAQGGHGVFLSGDIRNPPGRISVSPTLSDPALAGWTG